MEAAQSDALVFFGASGDLAFKQIFPALLGLVNEEGVNVPIVGVAKAGWTVEQLKGRAKDSIEKHGGADAAKLDKLLKLLRYVDGDYNDPKTFEQLKQALGGARRPLHYLAIPPSLFGVVVSALAKSGLNVDARLVVEKPFGRDRELAQALNHTLLEHFPEEAIFRIDHYLGKEPVQNIPLYAVRQFDLRAALEPPLRSLHPDHDGGSFRRSGQGEFLRRRRRPSRRAPEPHATGPCERDDGRPDRRRARGAARPEGGAVEGCSPAGRREPGARAI